MTRRFVSLTTISMTLLFVALGTATAAAPTWHSREVGTTSAALISNVVSAENARGDAVVLTYQDGQVAVRRTGSTGAFGSPVKIRDAIGAQPLDVSIDGQGTALIVLGYFDNSQPPDDADERDEGCCEGLKTVVWRRGHTPSAAHAVRPRGTYTAIQALNATTGHRGVVVAAIRGEVEGLAALEYEPIGLDGRPGRAKAVASADWRGLSLQYQGGRPLIGMFKDQDGPPGFATMAFVRSDHAGAFKRVRTISHINGIPFFSADPGAVDINNIGVLPDRVGGALAYWIDDRSATTDKTPERLWAARIPARGPTRRFAVSVPAREIFPGVPAVNSRGQALFLYRQDDGVAADPEKLILATRARSGSIRRVELSHPKSVQQLAVAINARGDGLAAYSFSQVGVGAGSALLPIDHHGTPIASGARIAPAGFFSPTTVFVDSRGVRRALYTKGTTIHEDTYGP